MNIDRLKEIRLDRDLLQRDVAEAIGIKRQQYSEYEIGKRLIPIGSLFNYLLSVSSLATIFFKASAVACFNSATLFSITGVPFSTANLYNSSAFF